MIDYPENFLRHYRSVIKRTPNVKDPRNAQKLSSFHQKELYHLFCARPSEYYSISRQLNDKKKLETYHITDEKKPNLEIYLNMNSSAFLRDSNYSLSLATQENGEIAILSFEPAEEENSLLITQIQSKYGKKTKEVLPINWRDILFESMTRFANHLKIRELQILRAEYNPYYIEPNHLRQGRTLEEHQESMRMTYNVTPRRKWNFKYKKGDLASKLQLYC